MFHRRSILKEVSVPTVVHAERNAIEESYRNVRGSTLYTTRYPCVDCAELIKSRAIRRVVYVEDCVNNSGLEILKAAGIPCVRIPEGELGI